MKLEELGLNPEMGGAAMLYAGIIVSNQTSTNEATGEITRMIQVQWFGATQYFNVNLDHPLGQVANGTKVLLCRKQNKGKNGYYNDSTDYYSTTAGGFYNEAGEYYATVSGGAYNAATGTYASVSGGYGNEASGSSSSILGGYYNDATGSYSTVYGSYYQSATTSYDYEP